jgi:hypothetical protein
MKFRDRKTFRYVIPTNTGPFQALLRRIYVATMDITRGGWRKLHSEMFHNFYGSVNNNMTK